ncbi:hypothetical protein JCM10207_001337 [Rhodosporidiobolus poonsookiae]
MAAVASSSTAFPPQLNPNGPNGVDSLETVISLLEEDLREAEDRQAAERMQLEWALEESAVSTGKPPLYEYEAATVDSDDVVSLRQELDTLRTTLTRSAITHIARSDATVNADHLCAVRTQGELDEARGTVQLDAEFARALQAADETRDMDDGDKKTAEAVLGQARVQDLKTSAPSASTATREETTQPQAKRPRLSVEPEGKGKAVDKSESSLSFGAPVSSNDAPRAPPAPEDFICSVCLEPCQPSDDPQAASRAPSASHALPVGVLLGPKRDKHVICLSCAQQYIQHKLDASTATVFPIHCHQCLYQLTDEDAAKILGEDSLDGWHYRKLLDSEPAFFCPNKACSERLVRQPDFEENPDAECPACHKMLCVRCEVIWHEGYTCEQYQALPPDTRDRDDLSLLDLAREKRWSRCPKCKVMIEHVQGCAHMTCTLCGAEHCYLCGSKWKKTPFNRYGRCSRDPPCPLWAREADLLRPEFRDPARRGVNFAAGVAGAAAAALRRR